MPAINAQVNWGKTESLTGTTRRPVKTELGKKKAVSFVPGLKRKRGVTDEIATKTKNFVGCVAPLQKDSTHRRNERTVNAVASTGRGMNRGGRDSNQRGTPSYKREQTGSEEEVFAC